ncbi:putative protease [Natranaerovirga pectinivora]|uniref:Putative protease n=1 Tax=Natranaerovirga pectinivora TaxID=682400 RepID=A0A4R3MT49_9FIRM|nr:U32 family peptidase [Natranaerovirga pectinivora]TCT16890.1 putative protease [Natranaerovirga pectinivora]
MKKTELLIPAGNLESLKVAVKYGADAVYIGGEMYGLRAKAKNFSLADMKEGIDYAHKHNAKVYVTANIIAHNEDIEGVAQYFKELKEIKPDAVIIADPGILEIAKEIMPDMEIHISTQANNTNYRSFNFWHKLGVSRVVAARELSLEEIKTIHNNIPEDLEIEAFIHGAMCISYSGRCLLSSYFTGKDANKGACTHPCRWNYNIVEETRPGEYMPVYENKRGTFIFNSKDLCMIEYIPQLIEAGIHSLKIEGRMKTLLYVATVASTYRKALDDYFKDPSLYEANLLQYIDEIKKCSYRPFSTGFYFDKPDETSQIYENNSYIRNYTFIGIVIGYDNEKQLPIIEQRYKFGVGDEIEVMKKDGKHKKAIIEEMWDEEGSVVTSAPHPKQKLIVKLSEKVEELDILRKRGEDN